MFGNIVLTENIIMAIGSCLAFTFLLKSGYKRFLSLIIEYQDKIDQGIKEAKSTKQNACDLLQKYKKQKEDISLTISEMLSSAKSEADKIIENAKATAKIKTDEKMKRAKNEIDLYCNTLVEDFDKKIINAFVDTIKTQSIDDNTIEKKVLTVDKIIATAVTAKVFH